MRSLCLFLLSAAAVFSQPFGFGIKGGVPMTDFLNGAQSQNFAFVTSTNRYVVGPAAELRLPFGLGIEVDALYRHYDYSGSGTQGGITSSLLSLNTTGGAWEFPLLAKYKFKGTLLHPFVDAGVSWDKLSGLTQAVTSTVAGIVKSSSTSNPAELNKDVTRGFVFGGGVDVKLLVLHIAPEIRYTRWGDQHFIDPNGLLHSNLNQAEFLVGITF
jgi:opacity protein-like surface antigen